MAETQVARREPKEVEVTRTPETDEVYVPDVDIIEDGERVRVLADMPAVAADGVEVTVDGDVLTLSGRAHIEAPEGYELASQEFEVGRFRRDFTLSDSLDTGRLRARLKDGVLEVSVPKREEMKKRKVTIEAES